MSVTKRSAANDVGFVHEDRSAVLLERFGEGVGAQQDRAIAEIVVGVTQRREHEVQLAGGSGASGMRTATRRAGSRGGSARRHTLTARAGRRRARGGVVAGHHTHRAT
jgi:hypothetical protein